MKNVDVHCAKNAYPSYHNLLDFSALKILGNYYTSMRLNSYLRKSHCAETQLH